MKHWLFTIIAAFSLVLCLLLAFEWVHCQFASEWFACGPFHPSVTSVTSYGIAAGKGTLGFQSNRYTFTGPNERDVNAAASIFNLGISINRSDCEPASQVFVPYPNRWNRLGFFRYRQVREGTFPGSVTMTAEWWYTGVPYWLPLLLTAILPICWWHTLFAKRWQQNRRVRLGLCLHCGYDLRASKERCPECGTPTSTMTEAKT